jgi:hypothetical protein
VNKSNQVIMHVPLKFLMKLAGPQNHHRFAFLMMVCLLPLLTAGDITAAEDPSSSVTKGNVGMSIQLDQVVITGPELEVIPLSDEKQPLVLRIEAVWSHGSDFRYDFSFYGLEPGTFDLKSQLRRKDGSSLEEVQSIPVIIESILPPGKAEPAALEHHFIPVPGGYKQWMTTLGILWIAGLIGIAWSMRKRKKTGDAASDATPPLSLGEKLEPLVKAVAAGNVSGNEKAELERLLLTFWSKKLDLKDLKSSKRIQKLKEHPEAKTLICAVEKWLHSPESVDEAEIQSILKPYRPSNGLRAMNH